MKRSPRRPDLLYTRHRLRSFRRRLHIAVFRLLNDKVKDTMLIGAMESDLDELKCSIASAKEDISIHQNLLSSERARANAAEEKLRSLVGARLHTHPERDTADFCVRIDLKALRERPEAMHDLLNGELKRTLTMHLAKERSQF